MIQKNGHIIAIDQAKVNAPLSGNGRSDSPIGLNLKIDDTLSGNGTNSKPLGVKSDLYVTNEDFSIYSAVPHAVVSSTDKNVTITSAFNDGVAYYDISFTADPIVSDTNIFGVDGIRARWDSSTSAYYIGVSAKYLSANALNNYSGNWQNTYNTVKANSAKWNEASAFSSNSGKFALKTDVDNKFTATSAWAKATFASASQLDYYYKKTETSANGELDAAFNKKQDKLTPAQLSAISSVSSIKSDLATHVDNTDIHIQESERDTWNTVSSKTDKSYVDKGLADTSAWAKETFQPIGEYLSANVLDDLSGHWDSVYNSVLANSASWNETSATLNTNSGKWDSVYNSVLDNSASWNETSATLKTNSGYWDSVYSSVLNNSANWNETSAVVNENSGFWGQAYTALTSTSAIWNNHSALSATKLDKDAFEEWSATTEAWDKIYYSGADGIKVDEHIISISADYLSANALDDYSGRWNSVYDSVFDNSASWNETSATLKENSGKWEESYTALTDTSATWNNHSALSATKLDVSSFENWKTTEFEPVKTDVETLKANSAHYPVESTNEYITVNSADHKFALTFVSGDLATQTWVEGRLGKFGGYVPCEGTDPDNHPNVENPDPKKMYLVPKDGTTAPDRYYNWIVTGNETTGWLCVGDTSMDLTPYLKISDISGVSGNWNTAYTYVTANSANIESVSSTVNANSGKWNEVSAFSANSGKFVTSALNDFTAGLAHVLTKDEQDNVAWSGIDLSDLGKMYPITSLTPDLVSATISAVDGTSAYVLSAKEPEPVEYFNISADKMSAWSGTEDNTKYYFLSGANISGNNGISAEYNPEINQWDIGLKNPNYNYAVARTNVTTLTATSETISGFVDIDAAGITFKNDVVTLDKGLYHVDIQVNVPVETIDESYYDVTLTPSLSYAVLRQTIDASYAHNTTLDLSFDINLLTDDNELTFTLAGLPVGASYRVENFQIHEVTTIDSLIDIDGGIYHAGVATQIDGQNNINVQFNPASGIDVDANNKLYVKLGKGLKFDEAGAAAGTLTLDNVTEEVVDTVQNLKSELDNKLTMNMNYSDAKKVGSPVNAVDGGGACMVASLFHVNLTHEINENTELTIYCSQACPQSDALPYMFGVFEYNFNYYDNDPSSPTHGTYRPQTTWLFDTGILDATIPANKYTMKVKNIRPVTSYSGQDAQGNIWVNDYKAEMRSDRLYYAAMFCRQKTDSFKLLCDEGYEANTNSNPKITWFNDNMKYCGPLSATVPANIGDWGQWGSTAWEAVKGSMTFNDVNWWGNNTSEPDNTYREKNTAYRYLLQIRNNNTNVGGN